MLGFAIPVNCFAQKHVLSFSNNEIMIDHDCYYDSINSSLNHNVKITNLSTNKSIFYPAVEYFDAYVNNNFIYINIGFQNFRTFIPREQNVELVEILPRDSLKHSFITKNIAESVYAPTRRVNMQFDYLILRKPLKTKTVNHLYYYQNLKHGSLIYQSSK
jgi:hypothetical protein